MATHDFPFRSGNVQFELACTVLPETNPVDHRVMRWRASALDVLDSD